MPLCSSCHAPMINVGGIGFPPHYVCNNTRCPSNKARRLKCPNPACKGQELDEAPIGIGHQMYTCSKCGFAFDNLGQVAPPVCKLCEQLGEVYEKQGGGFLIACPNGHNPLSVDT